MDIITSGQIRAARALVGWTAQKLADEAGVGVATIRRMELADNVPQANLGTFRLIANAFARVGIEFLGTPDDSPGVRLRTPTK